MNNFYEMLPRSTKPKDGETLSSFLIRLAKLNRIKSIRGLSVLLFPDTAPNQINNLIDHPPLRLAQLCKATRNSEETILKTTFHFIGKNFGRSTHPRSISSFLTGSLADSLRYCPKCLSDEDPYYRLTWRFKQITTCSKHQCQLLDTCGFCGRSIPIFDPSLEMAICPYCKGELWKVKPEKMNGNLRMVEEETKALEMILNPVIDWSFYKCGNFTEFLGHQMRAYRQSNQIPYVVITRRTMLDQSHITHIENGKLFRSRIGFVSYMKYLKAVDLSLYEILTNVSINEPLNIPESNPSQKNLIVKPILEDYYVEKVIEAIRQLQNSGRKLTTVAIARIVGVSPNLLYSYKKARNILPRLGVKSKENYESVSNKWLLKVKEAWIELFSAETIPTNDEIAAHIGLSRLDHHPEILKWLNNAREKGRGELRVNNEKAILEQLDIIETDLIDKPILLSNKKLASLLGISYKNLHKYPLVRSRSEQLIKKTKAYPPKKMNKNEEDLVIQIQEIRENLKAQGIKESQAKIEKLMHMTVAGLRKYPKVKVIFDEMGRNYRERNK